MTIASRLLLVDGNNLVHRAYHALPPLTVRRTGEVVNAVYGFASMLLKVLAEQKPTHCAVAFDMKGPTFRHLMYNAYKAQRPHMAEDLVPQMARVRDLVTQFNIPIFEADGYEADDVLGTLAHQAVQAGINTLILTGDADAMQLVGRGVGVLYPRARQGFGETAVFDSLAVREKYGVDPERIVDLKALVGDASDNIPGVHGIGEKTAVKLIQQFGGLDEIYACIEEVAPLRIQTLLKEGELLAHQSKELATIVTDVPVALDLEKAQAVIYDREKAVAFFRELEFFALLDRLPDTDTEKASVTMPDGKEKKDYHVITNSDELAALAARLTDSFAFDIITDGLNPMAASLVGLAISLGVGEACYLPLQHGGLEAMGQIGLVETRRVIGPAFASYHIAKTTHNAAFALTVLREHGFEVNGLSFDTALAAHLLGEASLELGALVLGKIGRELPVLPVGSGAKRVPASALAVAPAAEFGCAAAGEIACLGMLFESELRDQKLWQLFDEVELPLVPVLVGMQQAGVLLDRDILGEMSVSLGDRLEAIQGEIYKLVGHEFNINSPRQLGVVLFEELQLKTDKKRGGYSTEAVVLESLRTAHPVIGYLLEYRQLAKLKSTYVDTLPALIHPRTGRVHTSFNQTRTSTGRLSSSEPNLQNIPVRGDLGREIRRTFVAPPGAVLFSGDYSQIDLRALAHLSQDSLLMETFARGDDVHTATAAQLFDLAPEQVTADMRRLAKTVNFGVIYGMSGYGLEQATEFSRLEAERFIAEYFRKYSGVWQYLERTRIEVRERGYVQTVLGRRRYIPEIRSPNRMVRETGERMAINMPVQGTSADIIKIAMLRLDEEIRRRKLTSRLILQVHDELIFEVPEAELVVMEKIVPELMAGALQLSVPIEVNVKSGRRWGDME
ncbi:MAG: DNA polymerase I [Dehalococcoidia bacterium]|nr:DNA polymerase I [Dehalococcoidia bacterium]